MLQGIVKSVGLYSESTQLFIYFGFLLLICFLAGIVVNFIIIKSLGIYYNKTKAPVTGFLIKHMQKPMHLFIPMLFTISSLPTLSGFHNYLLVSKIIYILFCISFAWLLIKLIYVFSDTVLFKHNISTKDNLSNRKLITQLQFLRRLLIIIVVIIFISAILLNFDNVRKLGTGILTSAGVLGLIIGFAAQKSISNLLTGLQIAFSQPIRIDDVVIVENEWGNIEEINLTYVVVRLWDLRRLVVPLNYFNEKPFQNWTRTSADILGTVFLYLDYKMPVNELREELTSILKSDPLWDGKVNVLQVTDATEKAIEVRALMSARNASDAWDLRCNVREKLVNFIQQKFPEYLPKLRTEVNLNTS